MKKVKLAVLGCGFMGQGVHLPNFLANPKCEVVGVCDVRKGLATKVAERFGLRRVWAGDEELAQDPEVEAVAAIVQHAGHPAIVMRLLNAGKHVFTEKPMADSADDARQMAAAAKDADRVFMVAYMKRYDPGVQWARNTMQQLMEAGQLGALTFARVHCFGGDWIAGHPGTELRSEEPAPRAQPRFPSWLPDGERGNYSGFNNVYTHQLNLLRFLLGRGRVLGARRQAGAYLVTLDFNGALASLEAGGMKSRLWEEETLVCFQSGWLRIETPPPLLRNVPARVRLYVAGREEIIEPRPEWRWAFEAEADHFLDCVLAGQQPLSSGEDSVDDVELVEQVFRCLVSNA
jgi:predicted dehydrogenase